MERIDMLGPHFAYLGRRFRGGVRRFIGQQAKASKGLFKISVCLIACRAVILGAQGVAGDGD
jgi:hypothetical protein